MGAYADVSARLIERGFAAIPIIPGTKRPGFIHNGQPLGLSNWQKRFNRGVPSESIRARWGEGETGVGVIMGPPSHGAVAIDVDTDDPAIMAAIMGILPPSPCEKRGAKGKTSFYHGPAISESRTWKINGKTVVDLIGPGRQTVLPPTIHPDTGLPYGWISTEALENVTPDELPPIGADIVEAITAALAPFGCESEPAPRTSGNGCDDGIDSDDDTPHRQLNDMALENLSAWVPALGLYRCRPARGGYEAVPMWRPSTTGREPEKRHRNLKIVPAGIRDFGADQGFTPLDLIMEALGCDLDDAWQFLSERLGFGDGPTIDLEIAQAAGQTPAETAAPAEEEAQESAEALVPAEASTSAQPALKAVADPLKDYTHCPGLVGDVIDWITSTARRPNRVLALGAAVTIVGTLIGRRVAGPTRSATHLYVVPIAGSGTGKQHILDGAIRLLHAAKAHGHIGPSRFHSGSSVFQRLNVMPLMLCLQDEVGAVIRAVTDSKASSHERAVGELLRSLWGLSFGVLPAPAWATANTISSVSCPAVSILGVSTSEEFLAALQGDSVENGLLNRFLVLKTSRRAADTDPALDPFTVPRSLGDALHQLHLWSGPASLLQIADPQVRLVPEVLPWTNEQARACYANFVHSIEQQGEEHPETAVYLARCAETAVRLATIRAAGRWGHGATVDCSDMEWGAGIARAAGLELAGLTQDFLPRNERSEITAKIASYIVRKKLVKPRNIQQFLKGRLRSPEIKDILAQLVEAGEIERTNQGYQPRQRVFQE